MVRIVISLGALWEPLPRAPNPTTIDQLKILQVVDETCASVGTLVLSVVSDPVKLARIMAALLGIAFVGLLVGNFVTLAGTSC